MFLSSLFFLINKQHFITMIQILISFLISQILFWASSLIFADFSSQPCESTTITLVLAFPLYMWSIILGFVNQNANANTKKYMIYIDMNLRQRCQPSQEPPPPLGRHCFCNKFNLSSRKLGCFTVDTVFTSQQGGRHYCSLFNFECVCMRIESVNLRVSASISFSP